MIADHLRSTRKEYSSLFWLQADAGAEMKPELMSKV
jgi:hypothetical protein